jgi:hypothetical protein
LAVNQLRDRGYQLAAIAAGLTEETAVTDLATRTPVPGITMASSRKRARRFWASMGTALRQSSRRLAGGHERMHQVAAVRVVSSDARSWRGR